MKKQICRLTALLLALVMLFALAACSNSDISTETADEDADAETTDTETTDTDTETTDTDDDTAADGEAEELHVGFIIPDTGSQATMGPLGRAAQQMAYERYGIGEDGVFAGRKIVLHIEDSASDAAIGVQKAQKLVEEYNCEFILGPLSGSVSTAVKEYAGTQPDVTFIMCGGGDTMTYGVVYDNVFRLSVSGAQASFAQGEYAAEQGYKKVLTVAPDNDFQYSWISGFKYTFIPSGGEVVSLWFPESGNDFSSIFTQIPDDTDAILLSAFGAAGADFLKQLREFGYAEDMPILSTHSAVDTSVLSNPELAQYYVGAVTASHTPYPMVDNEYYDWFSQRHTELVGYPASVMTTDPYCCFVVLFDTLEALNGDTSDLELLRSTMSDLVFDTPVGTRYFDENRQVVVTEYLVQVVYDEETQTYHHEVLKEYDDVTQFGPYDPDWFASQPLPDRDNPTVEAIMSAEFAE